MVKYIVKLNIQSIVPGAHDVEAYTIKALYCWNFYYL